jgi:Dolichyl-phosphate-mannose-protein mannosyltransferase
MVRGTFARLRGRLTDEWAIVLLAALLSIGFFAWFAAHGDTLAFNDARSRELIARRVILSRTPGLAQFGVTWLPLPFILMLPLIWNDALFRIGLAGALPSMLSYVVASVYIYRLTRLLTSSRAAGWVAAAALMLNPSLLYMQSTPMSETASVAALIVAIYYAVRLSKAGRAADIMKCAAAVAAGTLIRYENWLLAIAILPFLALIARRRQGYPLAEAWSILYGTLAFAGCAAWVLYNGVIFHDPFLSFFYGQSSHTYYAGAPSDLLPARHHLGLSFQLYGLTVAKTVGWALAVMAALGLIAFIWRSRPRLTTWPALLVLLPFGFYWLVLYRGVNTMGLPELGTGPYYNVRFGIAMIPAVALFCGFLATAVPRSVKSGVAVGALTVIIASSIAGLVLQTPLAMREAVYGYGGDTRQTGASEARWISANYRGGNILCTYVNDPSFMFYLLASHGFPDQAFITDANGPQFAAALAHPERSVRWIIMSAERNPEDHLSSALHRRTEWRRWFVLRRTFPAHRLGGRSFGASQVYERRTTPLNA